MTRDLLKKESILREWNVSIAAVWAKTENCQSGVFLAYAGDNGYGLVDCELYIPQEWFRKDFEQLYKECHIPEEKTFSTKNEIALKLLNHAMQSGLF